MAGIYIHIPFCKQACVYCNFHFKAGKHATLPMTDAICKELAVRNHELSGNTIKSLYFGGGTPSLLSVSELARLLHEVQLHYSLEQGAEITLEANPEDLTQDRLLDYASLGINRLSIGVQSFNDEVLRWMNRGHTAEQAKNCVYNAQNAGFNAISVDLISGVPIAPERQHLSDIEIAHQLPIQHLSCYSLTLEPQTTWAHLVHKQLAPPPIEDQQAAEFSAISLLLSSLGWIHYEVSNFARTNFSLAQHNSSYWSGDSYIGVGPSAHSYDGKKRKWNLQQHRPYMLALQEGRLPPFEQEVIDSKTAFNEKIMTGLRTAKGVFIPDLIALLPQEAQHVLKSTSHGHPLLEVADNHLRLKPQHFLFADGVASDLFVV